MLVLGSFWHNSNNKHERSTDYFVVPKSTQGLNLKMQTSISFAWKLSHRAASYKPKCKGGLPQHSTTAGHRDSHWTRCPNPMCPANKLTCSVSYLCTQIKLCISWKLLWSGLFLHHPLYWHFQPHCCLVSFSNNQVGTEALSSYAAPAARCSLSNVVRVTSTNSLYAPPTMFTNLKSCFIAMDNPSAKQQSSSLIYYLNVSPCHRPIFWISWSL